jgi:transcriptional antiterminator NusG
MITLNSREKEIKSPAGQTAEFHMEVKNDDPIPRRIQVKQEMIQLGSNVDAADWSAYITGLEKDEASGGYSISLAGGTSKLFVLNAEVPKGAACGDKVDLRVSAQADSETQTMEMSVLAIQSIFAVKTAIGHEAAVMEALESRARTKGIDVKAMLAPDTLRGYVLVEAMSLDKLKELVKYVVRARSVVDGETSIGDIEHYLTPKKTTEGMTMGDIVEIVSGGFKGEKARVLKIDELKEEITVELFEAIVPIPITVRGESVKLLEKKKG